MIRNSVAYRRLCYIKKRNIRRLRAYFTLVVIVIISTFLLSIIENNLLPTLKEISQLKASEIITQNINSAVKDGFFRDFGYEDLVNIGRDGAGRITSIETKVQDLNRLTAEITAVLNEKMFYISREKVSIPFGVLFGNSLLAGAGPDLNIDIVPYGSVETQFRSEFSEAGINQTRHIIFLRVKTCVEIAAPMLKQKKELITDIPLAETVIVGSVPEVYLNTVK